MFEQLLVDDGILLFKYWLCCDQAKQEERFAERLDDPLKRWKLSPIDLQARAALRRLHPGARSDAARPRTPMQAPWTLVDFNDQKRGRLTLIRDLLDRLPDTRVPETKLDFPPLAGKPREGTLRRGPAAAGQGRNASDAAQWPPSSALSSLSTRRPFPPRPPHRRAASARAERVNSLPSQAALAPNNLAAGARDPHDARRWIR